VRLREPLVAEPPGVEHVEQQQIADLRRRYTCISGASGIDERRSGRFS
jgi:hypothetical protein